MKLLPDRTTITVESEQGQAFFRFFTGAAVLAIYGVIATLSGTSGQRTIALVCIGCYVAYAYVWLWVAALEVGQREARQWAAVVLDQVIFAVCFGFGGPPVAALAWVPVTTSVGHGLRFGERRGTVAAVAGSLAVFCAVMSAPPWQAPFSIAVGIAASALIVPLYVVRLVRTMNAQRRDAERQAQVLAEAVRLDKLTGALSRAGFEDAIQGLHGQAQTTGEHIGLVLLDLDGFKQINDTRGHNVGDAVLQEVVKCLLTVVRTTDAVARFGGDEFVIIVKGTSSDDAVARVADKAVEAIRQLPNDVTGGLPIGASAGVAVLRPGGSVSDALISADLRMFAVKRARKAGRPAPLTTQEQLNMMNWRCLTIPENDSVEDEAREVVRRLQSAYVAADKPGSVEVFQRRQGDGSWTLFLSPSAAALAMSLALKEPLTPCSEPSGEDRLVRVRLG